MPCQPAIHRRETTGCGDLRALNRTRVAAEARPWSADASGEQVHAVVSAAVSPCRALRCRCSRLTPRGRGGKQTFLCRSARLPGPWLFAFRWEARQSFVQHLDIVSQSRFQDFRPEPIGRSHSVFLQQSASVFAHPFQRNPIFQSDETVRNLLNCPAHKNTYPKQQ